MSDAVPFDQYLSTLGRLTGHVDPTASSPEADDIREAAESLAELSDYELTSLAAG